MRIAISGTSCQGKSTLVKDFLEQWPSYTTPEKTYRDIIAEDKLEHSSKTNKETQRKILDFQIEQIQKYRGGDNVLFDRCPLDNLVYSMWACEQEGNDIDEDFVSSCLPLVRESFRNLDIIFFVPITKAAPISIVEDGVRDTNQKVIEEIDYIFKAVHRDHEHNPKTNIFVVDDKPAIIEVFGNRRERVEIIKLYIDAEGDCLQPGNLIDDDTLQDMEKMNELWDKVDPEEGSVLKKELEKHKDKHKRLNT